jgi:hypothetical protein
VPDVLGGEQLAMSATGRTASRAALEAKVTSR